MACPTRRRGWHSTRWWAEVIVPALALSHAPESYPTHMTDLVLQVASALLVLLSIVKMEAMVATDVFLARKGTELRYWLNEQPIGVRQDVTKMWTKYKKLGAGKLPWFPVGIKQYRLYTAAESHTESRYLYAFLVGLRQLWRMHFLAPLIACYVAIIACVNRALPVLVRIELLVTIEALLISTVSLVIESIVARQRLGGWASHYHHWPEAPTTTEAPPDPIREAILYFACAGLAYVLFVTLLILGVAQFSLQGPNHFAVHDLNSISSQAFTYFFQASSDSSSSAIGTIVIWTDRVLWLFYGSVIVGIVTSLISSPPPELNKNGPQAIGQESTDC